MLKCGNEREDFFLLYSCTKESTFLMLGVRVGQLLQRMLYRSLDGSSRSRKLVWKCKVQMVNDISMKILYYSFPYPFRFSFMTRAKLLQNRRLFGLFLDGHNSHFTYVVRSKSPCNNLESNWKETPNFYTVTYNTYRLTSTAKANNVINMIMVSTCLALIDFRGGRVWKKNCPD